MAVPPLSSPLLVASPPPLSPPQLCQSQMREGNGGGGGRGGRRKRLPVRRPTAGTIISIKLFLSQNSLCLSSPPNVQRAMCGTHQNEFFRDDSIIVYALTETLPLPRAFTVLQ